MTRAATSTFAPTCPKPSASELAAATSASDWEKARITREREDIRRGGIITSPRPPRYTRCVFMLALEVVSGNLRGRVFELLSPLVSIGRAESNTVVLPDYHLSGEHGQIFFEDDQVVFTAPLQLAYPYDRTVGPTLSRFFTEMKTLPEVGSGAPAAICAFT